MEIHGDPHGVQSDFMGFNGDFIRSMLILGGFSSHGGQHGYTKD